MNGAYINLRRKKNNILLEYFLPGKEYTTFSLCGDLNEAKIKILEHLKNYDIKKIHIKSTLESPGITKELLERYNGYDMLKKEELNEIREFLNRKYKKRKDITFTLTT